MKKYFLIVLSVLFVCGCASVESAVNEFKKIDYSDGINQKEAQLIAQNYLIGSRYRGGAVDILKPSPVLHQEIAEYPNYWFVAFPNNDLSSPLARYLVVVDKKTAAIIRQAWWNPSQKPGVKWIFEEGKVSF